MRRIVCDELTMRRTVRATNSLQRIVRDRIVQPPILVLHTSLFSRLYNIWHYMAHQQWHSQQGGPLLLNICIHELTNSVVALRWKVTLILKFMHCLSLVALRSPTTLWKSGTSHFETLNIATVVGWGFGRNLMSKNDMTQKQWFYSHVLAGKCEIRIEICAEKNNSHRLTFCLPNRKQRFVEHRGRREKRVRGQIKCSQNDVNWITALSCSPICISNEQKALCTI